jgi:hypothetical protein
MPLSGDYWIPEPVGRTPDAKEVERGTPGQWDWLSIWPHAS